MLSHANGFGGNGDCRKKAGPPIVDRRDSCDCKRLSVIVVGGSASQHGSLGLRIRPELHHQ